jgi:hypothetical protein
MLVSNLDQKENANLRSMGIELNNKFKLSFPLVSSLIQSVAVAADGFDFTPI